MHSTGKQEEIRWPTFILATAGTLWAAHASALFMHEYAHSFTAWILGWKPNPFALNYAHPTFKVFLMQLGISQNVDEARIFAGGHGRQAALISAAGAVLGNGFLSFPISRWLYRTAQKHAAWGLGMLAYWLTVASIGNFIDYVPVRTFITGSDLDQDMFAVERGFGWSPWTLFIVFGVPTALVMGYFFLRIEPATLRWLSPCSRARRVFVAILTACFLFDFYGAAGWADAGLVAHQMSVISVCLAAPLAAALTAVLSTTDPKA